MILSLICLSSCNREISQDFSSRVGLPDQESWGVTIILTDEGADCVLKALAQSKPPLEELLMGHNNLSPVGLRRLRQAATCLSPTLRVLDFCGAEDLENNGAVLIGRAIENICPKSGAARAPFLASTLSNILCRSDSTFEQSSVQNLAPLGFHFDIKTC